MTDWSILMPVLSTGHTPSAEALKKLCDTNASAVNFTENFCFVYIDTDYEWEGEEAWVAPLAAWMSENYRDQWVRFDPDGDVVEALPVYDW